MIKMDKVYDVAVIGAGPAGCMAAIQASKSGAKVVLLEKNKELGKKILLSGGGRCNFTNNTSPEEFIERFGKAGNFLRPALAVFSNQDVISFFKDKGLKSRIEEDGRVFPVSNRAGSVLDVLRRCLRQETVGIFYNFRVQRVIRDENYFCIYVKGQNILKAKKVILATGGVTYRATGSSGEGFDIAKSLRHQIVEPTAGLIPLILKENWIKKAQGIALGRVKLIFRAKNKKIASGIGGIIFTHFGISGPLVLDLSGLVAAELKKQQQVSLFLDIFPDTSEQEWNKKLIGLFKDRGSSRVKNILSSFLPLRMVDALSVVFGFDAACRASQLDRLQRLAIIRAFKKIAFTVKGTLPLDEGMVTQGGIPTREINPKTMESRIIPGFYFAGEIIDCSASSGGYNIQQAFSTGFLAGRSASYG